MTLRLCLAARETVNLKELTSFRDCFFYLNGILAAPVFYWYVAD